MRIVTAYLAVALAACSKSPPPVDSPRSGAGPCSPAALDLPTATSLPVWKLPAGCTIAARAPEWIVTEADIARAFTCTSGPPEIDLARGPLLVARKELSPAGVGFDALDDGTTLTLVSKFRSPCPGGPMPMPMGVTLVYQVSGVRTIAEASCSVDRPCR